MTGDASARRYERLLNGINESVILMDAPPETCGSQLRFVEIAAHLENIGLAAPRILAWDEALGLMVLEDLGQQDFSSHLRHTPEDERQLYEAAVDVLLALGASNAPTNLTVMTPTVGSDMIDIAFEWAASDKSASLASEIKCEIEALLAEVSPFPATLSLRDFHAENLIWRPDQSGTARVGLLDFQDAFVTHPAYDLASLLRDARKDANPDLISPLLKRLGGGTDMRTAFHVMAVQRNLRILGIFNRLSQRDGKVGYIDFIPRVRAHLKADLDRPELTKIAPLIRRAFGQQNEGRS